MAGIDPFSGLSRIQSLYDESPISDGMQLKQDQELGAVNAGYEAKQAWVEAKEAAEARKKAQKAAEPSGFEKALGIGTQIASIAKSFIPFCERRLKQDIRLLDDRDSWTLVRDLPLYQYEYRHKPGLVFYGPMVDEVEAIDPSLVVNLDVEAEALGIADGKPVRGVDLGRQRAYEAMALQQALRRIEALEARLFDLEAALCSREEPPADLLTIPCWGGREELPVASEMAT